MLTSAKHSQSDLKKNHETFCGLYLRIFVPEFPIIPQESSSSSDEYSKTGRNPTNNPTHDLFLIVILADTENKKSSEILEFQSFALIYYLLSRCVRYFNLLFYKTS